MHAWLMRLTLCVAVVGTTTGCYSYIRTNFERPIPTDEMIDSIVPGVSTRTELVQRFGPPMEDRRPTIVDRGRGVIPGLRQVYAEHDLLARRISTWEHELRRDYVFTIPFIYRHRREVHLTNRLFVVFDRDGVVEAVGLTREISE